MMEGRRTKAALFLLESICLNRLVTTNPDKYQFLLRIHWKIRYYGEAAAGTIRNPGKRLEILLQTVGATLDTGQVKVFFELNVQPREVSVPNRTAKAKLAARAKADASNLTHIAAPMPGLVIGVAARPGQILAKGDIILQMEVMKMQTALTAERAGTLKFTHVKPGDQVEAKDLVAE